MILGEYYSFPLQIVVGKTKKNLGTFDPKIFFEL